MTVSSSSRYAECNVVTRDLADGTSKKVLLPRPSKIRRANITMYQWKSTDRVDLVAYQHYQDSGQWWRFADVNPQILNWNDIEPGTMIRVPRVS
jgi:prophage DNA circulation protein